MQVRIMDPHARIRGVGLAQSNNQGIEVGVAGSVPVDNFLVG